MGAMPHSQSTLPHRYLARDSWANRSLWPIVCPLQIEIDLHNLPTAVSDRDRQNPRSKTLLPRRPLDCLLHCTAALLQHYAPGKPVRWMVLAMAVSFHAGVELLRGSVLVMVWTWIMISRAVVLLRAREFLLPSPSVSIPGPAVSNTMHAEAWAGVVPYRILLLSPSHAGRTADRCSKEIAKQILAWGRDQSHFPIRLVVRAKDRGESRAESQRARASLQRNAKTNARVNGRWGPLGPIGAGAARAGRGTAATRTGVSSPAPWAAAACCCLPGPWV